MSTAHTQDGPVMGNIGTTLDSPLPYVVQALLKVVSEALDMPEPEFDADDEGLYLTSVARRMDILRELLGGAIGNPSLRSAARAADEMSRWLTVQSLKYRPLVCDEMEPSIP